MSKYIKVKPLFEGQIHERQQFKVNIKGDEYTGIFHDGDVQWYHPQPMDKLEDREVDAAEAKVYNLLSN